MNNLHHPQNIIIAVMRLKKQLPELIGEVEWAKIQSAFETKSRQLLQSALPQDQNQLAVELISLLQPYKAARIGLNSHLKAIDDQRAKLKTSLLQSASSHFHYDETALDNWIGVQLLLIEDGTRTVSTYTAGKGGATSIKPGNIAPFSGAIPIANNAATVFFGAHPILIALGVLVTGLSIMDGVTKKIPEREASVYWGCVVAKNEEQIAEQDEIIRLTNAERRLVGLPLLEEGEIKISLTFLEKEIKCIERLNDKQWKVIEKVKILF